MPKIKIICTKEQRDRFVISACPGKFCGTWKDLTDVRCEYDTEHNNHLSVCPACWDKYVEFIDADGDPNGETALSPILVGDGYFDGEPVYDYWHCPKCDQAHDIDDRYNYCPTCGQRIYWETEEEELNG